jgi:hypothetical protein
MARLDADVLRMEENREVFSQPPGAADTILQLHGRSAILEQNCTASASARVDTFARAKSGCLDDVLRVMCPFFREFKGLQ